MVLDRRRITKTLCGQEEKDEAHDGADHPSPFRNLNCLLPVCPGNSRDVNEYRKVGLP